jgi:hypothetical protein
MTEVPQGSGTFTIVWRWTAFAAAAAPGGDGGPIPQNPGHDECKWELPIQALQEHSPVLYAMAIAPMAEGVQRQAILQDVTLESVSIFCQLALLLWSNKAPSFVPALPADIKIRATEFQEFLKFCECYQVSEAVVKSVVKSIKISEPLSLNKVIIIKTVERQIEGFEWPPSAIAAIARSSWLHSMADSLRPETAKAVCKWLAKVPSAKRAKLS